MRSEIIEATFIVASIWWAVFTAAAFFGAPGSFFLGERHFFTSWIGVLAGLLIGGGGVASCIYLDRKNRELLLHPEVKRGLSISIGKVPEQAGTPARSKVMPDLTGTPSLRRWMDWIGKASPEHLTLAKAIIRTVWNNQNLPATHVKGGHGGKTLFEHTVLVCEQMLLLSQNWEYTGLRGKSGSLVLALRDANYRFDRTDPLIGIVALAHDLGKIECYIREDGNIVGSRHDHDRVSSQMLARMPEFWNLPREDRSALLGSVGYYHHPQDLPLDQDGRSSDDRAIALLELLIKADYAAGDIEGGRASFVAPSPSSTGSFSQSSESGEKTGGGVVPRENVSEEQLWEAFVELVKEPGRVNGRNAKLSIGQKCGELVYFKEQSLRVELVKKLGISDMHRYGDGRYAFTEDLLETLIDKNVLYNWHEGQEYSKYRALFRVAFFNAENGGHLATWPATVIVKPGASIPFLSSLPDHPANPKIERPVYSENSARNKNKAGEESDAPVSGSNKTTDSVIDPFAAEDPFAAGPIMDDQVGSAPDEAIDDQEAGGDALAEMSPDIEAIERERKEEERAIQERKEDRISKAADARLSPNVLDKLSALDEVAPAEEFGRKPSKKPGTRLLAEIASIMEACSSENIKPIGEKEGVVWFRLSVLEAAAPGVNWADEAEKEHGLVKIKDLGETVAIGLIKSFN